MSYGLRCAFRTSTHVVAARPSWPGNRCLGSGPSRHRAGWCPAVALLAASLLCSCGGRDDFSSEYETATRLGGTQLLTDLLALDQKYPGRLELKVDLGALYLAAGEVSSARIYLEQGERLERRRTDQRLRSTLHGDLAQLELVAGRHDLAIEHATVALDLDAADRLGVVFTRAKAHRALGHTVEALQDCDRGWRDARSTMSREDFLFCADLYFDAGRAEDALSVLREFQTRYPYEIGIGLRESLLSERLGRVEESVLAALKELEYLRFGGRVTEQEVLGRVEALTTRLAGSSLDPSGAGAALARAFGLYVREDYPGAATLIAGKPALAGQPFGRYLALACAMEAEGPDPASLLEYESLEPYFRGLSGYYYHLWRILKQDLGSYSLRSAGAVLERGILLAPGTRFALETRRELGRLNGMDAEDSRWVLLRAEIQAIASQALAGADPAVLDPMYRLAATPDNAYQLLATVALKAIAEVPALRSAIAGQSAAATGRLKERLRYVLGE